MIFVNLDHANFVIAFEVDLAEVVFVKKVVSNYEPLVVVGEGDRSRLCEIRGHGARHAFASFAQQRDRGTNLSGRAISALKRVAIEERVLHGMQLVALR